MNSPLKAARFIQMRNLHSEVRSTVRGGAQFRCAQRSSEFTVGLLSMSGWLVNGRKVQNGVNTV